jgi:hypothetical protein
LLTAENDFSHGAPLLLRQDLSWRRQDTESAADTFEETVNYSGNLRWRIFDETNSWFSARYNDTDRTGSWSRFGSVTGGVGHELIDGLTTDGGGGFSRDESPGFTRDVGSGRFSMGYKRRLPFGAMSIGGSFNFDRTDQDSDTDTNTVFDESHVLTGIDEVPLNEDFVVTATVVVTNVPKTQTFVEDLDYRLVTRGATTSIERVVTGNILDGQEVLVNYDYLTGGTVEYDTINQGINFGFTHRYGGAHFRFSDRTNDVRSGVATTPLNDERNLIIGGNIDYPLSRGWRTGGNYEYYNRDEDISAYVSQTYRAYLQSGSYWNTSAALRVGRSTIDFDSSDEDSDRWDYSADIRSRLPGAVQLGYTISYSDDDGGTLDREEWRHSLRLDWGYRQMRISLRGEYVDIEQGDSRRETTRIFSELRRVF